MQLAGNLLGWKKAFEYLTSFGKNVARDFKIGLGARALAKFRIVVHLDVGDAVGAHVVGLCPSSFGWGVRLVVAKGMWAAVSIPIYSRKAEYLANQPVLLVIPFLAVDQNDQAR